ncbi:MAG TPA: non-ribosomal peptide synthase/polyketide synthase [Thermoanaerobaculia bacterium]|nr:non-ribosomal peptide synthase/polyketide synthase [Thermoanaerobaculia bacterium]
MASNLARLPFDLERGPFLRTALLRLAPEEHELVIALHHIAADGGSLGVLVRELAALYTAFAEGRPSPLTPLPVQYADYAVWQRRWLDAGVLETGLGFWLSRLSGELPGVDLPADRPRPAVLSHRGAHFERMLPARLTDRLAELARRGRATPFMALFAVYTALLHRYTGLEDLVVGSPIAGRNRVELEGLIGVFINNLVLRVRLEGEPGLRELLARVRETSLEAFAHQEVPFELLVDELRPGRDLSRTPLFQVMFVGQNAPLRRIELPGLALSPREVDLGTARFDLSLSMGEADGGWLGTWKFSADLFDAPTLARMALHFENLLSAAMAEPGRPVAELPLLAASERHQVALGWNDTSVHRRDMVLHELIAAQVEHTPEAIAVEFGDERLTYAELSRRADGLARYLRGQGVQTGSLVGISAERSIEMVVGLLGILKAGGAYVPFDPSYPADRLAYMREDSGVEVLLTQSELRGPFPEAGPIPDTAVPSGPAYAIYTSGSTGRPKGAAVPHRGIVNRLLWMQEAYGLGPDDRVLQKTPFSFDVSVWEFFWPLITGARLVVAPPGAHQDAPRLAALIREHGITTLHFVPSMLQIFLGQDGLVDQDGFAGACRSVRRVFASGEALPFELKERFLERLPGVELHNLYGPTEASVDVTFHACAPGGRRRTVPIGRPIANTSIVVLDRSLNPAPIGVPGELHIGGVGLAIGYVGRPELTAERFIPDPIGETPGGRLYKTGDLARFRPDGEVEFLGRLDHQVKIRGVRIELGEIEAALSSHPAVRETVVVARKEGLDHRLVAYLVPMGESVPAPAELRSFLRATLPEAMVPSAFVVLRAFPLNPSGKVDRKALPAPSMDRMEPERAYEAPHTPMEQRLAALWAELLGVRRVGRHDNFFELGGNSIQAAMLVNRLQRELGRILYVMALFDAPTVAELAANLGEEADRSHRTDWADLPVEAALEELRSAVARRLGRASLKPYAGPRLPRAVFLLSPFRSGSTLLRVMLAGHPNLFAPPELELLAFDTLGERREAYSGRDRFATEGLLRAVMELRGCGADGAREIVGAAEEQDLSVAEVYGQLQAWAGGRLVVDKTPSYALDRAALARAEELFEEPLYVHLVRHPRATIDSYVEARMDRVYQEYPFAPEEQAEMVWLLGHRNILEHLARVPAERQNRLLFEDLVKSPAESMTALCRFLGLDFEPAMLDPYEGRRMTDGLHAGTRMMGDPKFHQHQGIDASVADRWRSAGGVLRRETRELAAALGYPAPEAPLSFSQERLWFLMALDPGSPVYNMPAAVRLAGNLDVAALAGSFAEIRRRHEVLRTVFPAVEGRPVPRVLPAGPDPLPVIDLSGLPEGLHEQERLILEEARRPFDLARGPMLRTALLRFSPTEHVLLVTMHHIASDGWTIGIVVRELEALYGAFSQGLPSPLPELPLQYSDYAAWQRRWLDGPALEEHRAFWRQRLAGPLPPLELPTDRPRPAVLSGRGARVSGTVPVDEVRQWSQGEGVTLFLTLLAGFNALLHRYTGQDDLLVGIPIANRNRLETEGLIGFFLNMVPQRTDASGNPTFRELLERVRDGFLGSAPHQEMPFEKLVEDLQPERDLARAPIFQVQLSLQNTPGQALEMPGLTLTMLEDHNRTTKLDLTVLLFEEPGGLRTVLEYSTDLFDEPTMVRLLRHWETLLAGAVAAPGLRLAELPMLTAGEREQLLTGWNPAGTAAVASGPALHRLFERQVERRPDEPAVAYGDVVLTYRRLNERANRLARRLRALGVGPEVPVGLCVERSVDLIVGVVGILKAGGAYVPLDPAYPAERLSYILGDLRTAPVLVTQEHLVERFESADCRTVRLDADRESLAEESPENLPDTPRALDPGHLAYVIYTSGSTGRPKGVPVTHANVVRLFAATRHWFGFGPADVWTMFHSAAFDFSVWEIWGALLFGGRLVVVPRDATLSPSAFRELLVREKVTVLNQTPSAFRQLIKADEEAEGGPLSLRCVVFGGEALDLAALAPWIERHGDEAPALINMYGITETTVHVTWRRIVAADLARPGSSPVGVPIPDLRVHLLGRRLELLPVGVPGEIHVGGAGLARGYLGRPELTAQRFIPDPFSGRPGARLYRSGDLARRRPDGDVEYLGRIDSQVKVRGFRIELGEVEASLNRHPGVRESVVLALPDSSGGRRLVAYLVPRDGEVAVHELKEHLRLSLPEYMVPAAFVSLERLPLTGNGKVDRRALPAPEEAQSDREAVAPRNPVEARLAEAWREVLRVETVGAHDNFFELGGHSLLVAQLASRVRGAFGVELPLRAVFEAPDLAGLAGRIAAMLPERTEAELIPRVPRDEPLPLSFAQERLWFLDQLEPGSPRYNIPVAMRLRGSLSVSAFEATFREVAQRHETLRTSFHEMHGAAVQEIAPAVPLEVPLADLSALPEGVREAELARLMVAEAHGPFDLGRAPLLRVRLVRLTELDHAVVATFHHIVSDGWSMGVLVREVGALYRAFVQGEPSPLPELPIQYADFAAWQRGWLTGELLEAEIEHWRRTLEGIPHALDLPADRPRPAVQGVRGGNLRVALPAGLTERLKALALDGGATLFMALLAGFQALLHRYSRQEEFLVGSPVAGRNRREIEDLIGFFVNTLALRAPLGGDPSWTGLLGRVREVTLDAYAHQDLPFERLVEALAPDRDLSRAPLFQVLFVLQNTPLGALDLPGLTFETVPVETETAKFDLSLLLDEGTDGLRGFVEYSADLFDAATVERMMGHLETLLAGIVAAPDSRIWDLPMMGEGEREQVLMGLNRTELEHPREPLLHELILAQVERTPDAVALVHQEERLTYREIAERSARMAARLRAAGVGPEVAVGICLDRAPALLTSMLGVLRAGGFYVPLDPNYPKERLSAILDDSRAPVLVTEESCLPLLPATEAWIVRADLEEKAQLPPAPVLTGEVRSSLLAYTIYTSGSTGRPKGVAITHRNVVALTYWSREVYSDEEFAGVLGSTSICFDMSIFELFVTLAWGGMVILAENALELPELSAKDEVTLINTVPSAMSELVRLGAVPASVRTVNLGGEPLRGALARRIHELGKIRLYNVYGPSEDTTFTTWADVGPVGEPTIGRPLANERIYVLDRRLSPVPVGVPGEVYISGEGVTRGYLGRPELTAEKYLPDPFAGGGARMYRVGDLGRWRADGELEYLGRLDHQVKIRGFRVELGDVEAALLSHPGVREAVVVPREPVPGDLRLAAFVVLKGEAPDLRAYLQERLPEYMMPWALVPLDGLPLLPNGKVDRRALAKMDVERESGKGGDAASERALTPVEELIAGLWCDVLGLREVGIQDNFFSLGGHSLLATQLVSRLRETLGMELPLRRFFEAPTVAGLVRLLPGLGGTEAPALRATADKEALPLSFAQERLWFLDRLEGGGPRYNVPSAVRLTGWLDPAALAAAFREIVRRHEVLRTRFGEEQGRPVQMVQPPFDPLLAQVDLRAISSPAALMVAIATAEARRPFDLAAGPLLRLTLLRVAEEEHVLLLVLHHAIADAWSMGLLIAEVAALYGAAVSGRPSPLPELPLQYADYARWQRELLAGPVLEDQLAWWRERLEGIPAVLDLPADRPRTAVRGQRGGLAPVPLPNRLVGRLRDLGRRSGATLFMTLLAGFQALLARYAGGDEAPVGSPVAGRTRVETEPLIGFFTNTLVLRTHLGGDPTFAELLGRTRETTLGAYDHQDVPFERLVEELAPPRDLRYTPLFQVMLSFQNALAPLELPGLRLELLEVDHGTAKLDLTLALREEGQGLAARLEYDRGLFDAATAERIAGHFRNLLEEAVADPGRGVWDLPLFDEAEWRQIESLGRSGSPVGGRLCLHELVEARARLAPDAPAVISGEGTLSFGQLDARAHAVARHLRRLGVGPEVRVGLSLPRSAEGIVAILAILKAGGAWVPLDPALPRERRAWMLEDSGVSVLVTRETLREEDRGDLPRTVLPESLAYVIYTSASTGTPKGVGVEHGAAVRHLLAAIEAYGLTENDRVLQTASWSFDLAVEQILAPLAAGAAVVLWEGDLDPRDLPLRAAALGATVLDLPPALLQLWTREASGPVAEGIGDLPVRLVIAGGEALSPEVARLWPSTPLRSSRLVNAYGPTEAVVTATVQDIVGASAGVPIGRPLPGRSAWVLDHHGSPVPLGVAGELALGGVLARGYLGRPDATAERFVPDPFSGEPGARLYKTGDHVRWSPEGHLDFLGRIDQQVKVRGFRIELGEIETALARHPAVAQAAVVVAGDGADRRLVGFLVPREGGAVPDAAGLRAFLGRALPDYMVPAAFVKTAALPLTPGGKVDRRVLVRAAPAPESREEGFVAPSTPVERVLAGIWGEVLRLDRIGVQDDFFTLGGHSLLATQVQSRVREAFGLELPLRRFFEAPTVAAQAAEIEALRARRRGSEIHVASREEIPLSFAQERLWFLDRFAPGGSLYNMPAVVRFTGELRVAALEAAFGEVVRRHQVLRTALVESGGRPVQRIASWSPWRLPVVDLSALPEARREPLWRRLAEEEGARPFNLSKPPLMRTLLLRLAPRGHCEHVLVLTFHHVAADAWSLGIFLRELGTLYGGASLPEPALQYADFALRQREWLRGEVLEEQIAWWRRALAGLPGALELPADHPRPAVMSHRGLKREVALPAGLSVDLWALSRRLEVTPFMLLLTGFETLLSRLSGQEDLAVGSPIANRNWLETEGLIGFFVNTLALRLDLSGDPTFKAVAVQAREVTLGAYAHQDLPFEKLVEELVPVRDPSRTPLFQVLFALQNAPLGDLELPGGLELEVVPLETGTAKFDLSLLLEGGEEGLRGSLEYSTDLFEAATVDRLAGHLETLLAGIAAAPDSRIWDLPLMSEDERRQVLVGLNQTVLAHPREPLLHELILAQVERAPDAVALVYQEKRLTYREIAERSARMAARLRAAGVGPEVAVGICLDRKPALLTSLLGVLRAGGFYVPLDPNYPKERLSAILEDSQTPVLVTEERCLPLLPETGARIVRADLDEEAQASPVPDLAGEVRSSRLAYTIYTSGSTGRPKGVAITHRNVVALAYWSREVFSDEEFAGVLGSTSICFDMSVFELFVTLAWGGTVILAENALELPELPAKDEVTLINTVPSAMSELVRLKAVPPSVRTVNLGGEPLRGALARRIHDLGTIRLYNVYGPSEDTTFTTWADVGPIGEPTIGRPLANERIYVLDPRLSPVPVGVPGEIYVSGEGVTRGYLGRPDRTAEKFLPDPFGRPGARMYRVGDLGRWRADGELEYLGRIDHQVKIRGFRVELGDIEAALLSHPGVREAVVITREPMPGDLRLAAFVVLKPDAGRPDLRGHVKERLPEYMVPWAILPLAELPLLPNGKVDRRALASLELSAGAMDGAAKDGTSSREPHGPLEEMIAGLWREVLGIQDVGVHDDFFSLGGHSLLATQLVSRLRESLGIEMPLRRFFEAPTIAGLARILPALGGTEAPAIRPVPRWGRLPLSFAQERLWFLDQLDPGGTMYNIPSAARLTGELNVPALLAAINEIVRRHEVLRTGFAEADGYPGQAVQVIASWVPLALPIAIADFSALPASVRGREAWRILTESLIQPFDLRRPPMLRPALLRLGPDEHMLLLDFHHIASDGWSIGIFLRETSALYDAALSGRPSPLPELAIQYVDFAQWQREWLRGDVLVRHLDFWWRALEGAPPVLELRTDRPRAEVKGRRSAERRFVLPAALVAALARLGQSEGATLFSVMTAALQALLSRLSGQEDVVVGSPIANRNRLETEPLIGFFVNVLALRLSLSGDPDFLELVRRARETALGAYAHQDLPFERLVELLAAGRNADTTPIFQVLFTFQSAFWSDPRLGDLGIEILTVPGREAKFDLNFTLIPRDDGGLDGVLEYRAALYDAATMDRLASRFAGLLEAVVANPSIRLSDLPLLLSEQEMQWVREQSLKVAAAAPPGASGQGYRQERAAHVAPGTVVEEMLAGMWSELLGVETVGRHDDFFLLGGHSLLATRLLSQVRSAFGVDLPVRGMLEASTLEAQAALIEAVRGGTGGVEVPPLVPLPKGSGEGGPLPLSFAQQRLWFLEQFDPGNPTYNIPAAVRMTGPLDVAALERALAGVVARHDTLRSRFEDVEGEPVVVVDPEMALRLVPEDVPDETRMVALAREEHLRPFNLTTGPLVRARLLRLPPADTDDHVLLLTMHHIVSDGWSMGILVREVATLYNSRVTGQPTHLPELPIQYGDFAAWQRRWLEGAALEREIAWWQRRLAGAPTALELPTDRPRPLVKTSRGAVRRAVLPAALTARLREVSRRSGSTLFMTLLAGLSSFLNRYTRQEDVLVGAPIANRNRVEIEPLIGFFVNTLVMRADFSGEPSFSVLLGRVRATAMEVYDHQDLPFEKVVEAVRPDRDLTRSPLFQVAFALQNLPVPRLKLGDLTLGPVPMEGGTVKFDWDIAMEERGDEIHVRWAYNVDLFDPATIERAAGQLQTLLESAAAHPDHRVFDLTLLGEPERHAVETEWNAPDEYPTGGLRVHERIAAQAARRPEAAALLLDGEALTYGELDRRANRLANRLRRLGAGPESLVGVCLDRSFDLVVALLAVLKSGAAYVPLDPNYPGERLRFMLRDSGVRVLVARQGLIGELFGEEDCGGLRTVALDADLAPESDRAPVVEVLPDNPAYVIYTSGSTGVPKGVVISHRALSNRLDWASVYDVRESDAVLQKTSVSFDVSVFEVFGPLMAGAREVLVRAEAQRDPDGLLRLIAEHGVTITSFPPSLLYVLMERDGFDAACRTLRTVVTGGEVVPADLPDRLMARLPASARVLNRYGPTEATISVTSWTCRRGIEERVLPIGRPIAGAEVYILGPRQERVPVGVPGEVCLGGSSLARGYLNRPGLTAEKFVPHPFSAVPGERLYRTGDLARYRPDGAVEFVGRVDGQVKIRGFRVELGEVEAVLARYPGVREVAVADREESVAGQGTATRILVAWFVPEADGAVDVSALRDFARAELPAHMVPSAFVSLERLPLGPTGKVDRKALPTPAAPERTASQETQPEAAGTGLEQRIAAIWREVLEVERVGLHENFFDLGGHSLLMARVHGRLQKELGRQVSMVELFQYPTAAALATHLGGEARSVRPARRRTVSQDGSRIAIIGMAGRFPGAPDVERYWRNLCSGVEAISLFTPEELEAEGVAPALLRDPRYVRASGVLDGADLFDADFFGLNPREAEMTDPQHRVFLECAWEALESAGYAPGNEAGSVGVYAGASFSTYLGHLAARGALLGQGNPLMGNDKDFLATRVSYKLNLRGPSLTVQTACSTSLVAVHLACQALLAGECDMALAGGVSISVPLKEGYVYKEGAIYSPDGRCRAFDAEAGGTPRGSGSGIVVLKRLEDAVADGDTIHAVILGSAVNNDGSGKVGFTAPGVEGQAAVIAQAQEAAGVDPATVGYVETHGTGTRRGDPIEIAALTQAFGPVEKSRCALVSSKPNIGHLDAASGVASLIKAAFAVRQGLVPPTLNFERLNPEIAIEGSPFFINTGLSPWPIENGPRRAGVSSFGIGGTNAHLVLEEPPAPAPSSPSQSWQLLLLSARTEAALEAATERLAVWLEDHPEADLADVAYTLRVGRRAFPHRRMVVCRDGADAIEALRDPRRIVSGLAKDEVPEAPFALPRLEEHLDALGRFWIAGGKADWTGVQTGENRRRIALPTYPFERRLYWIDFVPTAASEGSIERLRRSAASGLPQVVVSAQDLAALLRLVQSPDLPREASPRRTRVLHPRPTLATPYIEPRSELELQVAGLWRDLLGIEGLGADDNFFELGGHSLLATQLMSQVRDHFGVEVRLARFFDNPTVAGLAAEIVNSVQAARIEEAALTELLAEIQGLSPEDLQARLAIEEQSLMEDGAS